MAINVITDYVSSNDYPWGRSHCLWLVCIEKTRPYDNLILYSYTKPTARQIRQWKKRAKHNFASNGFPVPLCSCFECMNRRGLA